MTAINIIRTRDAVHMLTDGAGFDEGRMAFASPKAWPMPHLNAVIAAAGPMYAAPMLFTDLALATDTFDGLKAGIVEMLQFSLMRFRSIVVATADPRFAVVVAGFSEATGPGAYVVHNDDRMPNPWTVQDLGPVALIPGDAETHAAFAAAFPGIDSGDDLDPERDGLRMLEIQRRNPAHGVGAFAQLTTVTRDGITTAGLTPRT